MDDVDLYQYSRLVAQATSEPSAAGGNIFKENKCNRSNRSIGHHVWLYVYILDKLPTPTARSLSAQVNNVEALLVTPSTGHCVFLNPGPGCIGPSHRATFSQTKRSLSRIVPKATLVIRAPDRRDVPTQINHILLTASLLTTILSNAFLPHVDF